MKGEQPGHWWAQNLLRPALIAAMMACLAAPLIQGIEWLIPDWDGTYLSVFLFVGGLEGILSERVLKKQRINGYAYIGSRAAELIVWLLLLKLANYIPLGLAQFWADAQTWTSVQKLVSPLDLFTATVFVPLWVGAIHVSRQVMELDVEEAKAPPPPDKTSSEYYLWLTQAPLVRERERALNWLGETFTWGGVMLLIASAVVFSVLPTGNVPAIPTLLYFALGIALLSQARFSVTSSGWQAQQIPVQPGIARRWLLWAVIFLVGIAVAARMLPTEYSMGPLRALYYLFLFIAEAFMVLVTLIAYALTLLLSLLFPGVETPEAPPLSMPPSPPPELSPAGSSLPWLEGLLSVLFWVMVLGIVGYAVLRFLQDRLGLLEGDKEARGTWWGRLLDWLRVLWQRWRVGWRGVQHRLARRLMRDKDERPIAPRLSRFFALRRLGSRDLVRYFYLSAIRRAAGAGQPRKPGQTPYQYRADLAGRFPDLEQDLGDLTEGFVKARYSPRPVQDEDVVAVKGPWQRIKAALRRRRVVRR